MISRSGELCVSYERVWGVFFLLFFKSCLLFLPPFFFFLVPCFSLSMQRAADFPWTVAMASRRVSVWRSTGAKSALNLLIFRAQFRIPQGCWVDAGLP